MVDELLQRAADRGDHAGVEAAVWALGFAKVPKRRLHGVIELLLDIVDDAGRTPKVRGHAAEGVGNRLERSTLATLRRHAILRLIPHLHDAEPEVRFWSAFSLGQLRARQARRALAALIDDDTRLPGWWSVGDEAADALMLIAGREPPDRDGRPI